MLRKVSPAGGRALPRGRPGAARLQPAGPQGPAHRYLCFLVAGVPMAMDLTAVQEVVEVPPFSRIPRPAGAAEHFAVVRDRLVLVVDLRKRLGLVNPVTDQQTRLIITAGLSRPWAFMVDAATEVLSLAAGAAEGQGAPGGGFRSELFAGSLEVRGSRVLLPDFAKLLGGP